MFLLFLIQPLNPVLEIWSSSKISFLLSMLLSPPIVWGCCRFLSSLRDKTKQCHVWRGRCTWGHTWCWQVNNKILSDAKVLRFTMKSHIVTLPLEWSMCKGNDRQSSRHHPYDWSSCWRWVNNKIFLSDHPLRLNSLQNDSCGEGSRLQTCTEFHFIMYPCMIYFNSIHAFN